MAAKPTAIMLAGPNGSGKTTSAATLLKETFGLVAFINSDVIAQGLSGNLPDSVALQASALLIKRLDDLVAKKESFAFETTLAAKSLAAWSKRVQAAGYLVYLLFLWIPDVELAVARVKQRVEAGGHAIPEETIRRRYGAGLRNLFKLYLPVVDRWSVFDSSALAGPKPIASGGKGQDTIVYDPVSWNFIQESSIHE